MSDEGFDAPWISAETERKEQDFRGLLNIHLPICRSILGRQRNPLPYLFVDLHGGPGNLRYAGKTFLGSPLIALDELADARIPYQTFHFEQSPLDAERLTHGVAQHDQQGTARVHNMLFEQGVPLWLDMLGHQKWRYGLVYSDPIKDPIPVETFNQIAEYLPRVDLLAYVAANNQYKRANANGQGHGRRLADDITAVNKRFALVRKAYRAEQYTFIVWSNWPEFPAWTSQGFYRLDEPRGQEIVEILDCTKAELHARRNTQIPFVFPPTAPMPSTSGTQDSAPSGRRSSSGQAGSANGASNGQRPNPTTSPIPLGGSSTSPRTSWPSATSATAEPTGRSGEDD